VAILKIPQNNRLYVSAATKKKMLQQNAFTYDNGQSVPDGVSK